MLWDQQEDLATEYYSSWKTCVKLAWGVPRATHSYFLDYLSAELVSVGRDVLARYAGFYRSLLSSPCREVTILARMVENQQSQLKTLGESVTWENFLKRGTN